MDTLLFGTMGIASLFSIFSFGGLAVRRVGMLGFLNDRYFWISAGVSIFCLGLLWFALLRTYQTMVMEVTPYVQNPAWALTGVAVLCAGVSCLVRAQALSNPHIGKLFLYAISAWAGITILWSII